MSEFFNFTNPNPDDEKTKENETEDKKLDEAPEEKPEKVQDDIRLENTMDEVWSENLKPQNASEPQPQANNRGTFQPNTNQFVPPQYPNSQYVNQGNNPQYRNPQYSNPQFANPQYRYPQYGNPQWNPKYAPQPNYAYNQPGNGDNKKKGMSTGALIAIIVGSIAVFAALIALMLVISRSALENIVVEENSQHTSLPGGNAFGNKPNEKNENSTNNSSRPDYSVPEFTPSGDADTDLSTVLTQIYDNVSPACCTIVVNKNGAAYSSGSGFVIDAEHGYVATNHHVIQSGDSIKVSFYNGKEYNATLVGSDATSDLAVLKIDAENLTQVEFGDSNNVKVGENVIAIGTPYDQSLAGTMTSGIISGVARGVEITNSSGKVIKVMTLLQTDCSINPGNSGGPLIDMAGNVVGITSLKLVDEKYEGIGFAIPITDALEIIEKLIAGEPITDNGVAIASPRIGVTVYKLEYGLSAFYIFPSCDYPEGILVGDIEASSSAFKAGLSRYDIITDFNGYTIKSLADLNNALSKFKAGDEVTVTVFRFDRNFSEGTTTTVTFKLDAAT